MNQELNSSSISTIVLSTQSSNLSAPTGFKPAVNLPSDNSPTGFQYWETGNSSNNSCSSGNSESAIELQNNSSLFDTGIFQWLDLNSDKEAQFHLQREPEDLKWSEFLNGSLQTSAATIQNQTQGLYADIKEEGQFTIDGLSNWRNDQHRQHQLQASDIHGKDIHKFTASFEQV